MVSMGCSGSNDETANTNSTGSEDLAAKAERLAQRFIIADTHIDVPYRLNRNYEDVSKSTDSGDFDFPRAQQGGLNAPFMSIYVPASYEDGGAKQLADELIDMMETLARDNPTKFAIATTAADIERQFAEGKMSLLLGMENGSPIEGDLENLRHFHARGIRYITLAHSKDNHISDSSYDDQRTWGGLSPFGKQLVREMNRMGVMIDVSHLSDDATRHVFEVTQAPVLASHSSARKFTPEWERNMSEELIEALAENGGVLHINFGSSFISDSYRLKNSAQRDLVSAFIEDNNLERSDERVAEYRKKLREDDPIPFADVADVADHIDYVVELVGIDHVGIGSDYDGVGDSLPTGLKDVSEYPNLIRVLLERGYSDEDIEKLCSGNILRVMRTVEEVAAREGAS